MEGEVATSATAFAPLWGWFSYDPLKFMLAAWFLTPELLHIYRESDLFRWAAKIGDFFKFFSDLQESCRSAAFWAVRPLQIHTCLR